MEGKMQKYCMKQNFNIMKKLFIALFILSCFTAKAQFKTIVPIKMEGIEVLSKHSNWLAQYNEKHIKISTRNGEESSFIYYQIAKDQKIQKCYIATSKIIVVSDKYIYKYDVDWKSWKIIPPKKYHKRKYLKYLN